MKTTGLSRVSKDLIIGEIERELEGHQTFILADHGRLPAASLDKLRAKLRGAGTRYLVVKNTLGKRAFEKKGYKDIGAAMNGACGVAFSGGDAVQSAKVMVDFAKENELFKIQQGYLNGRALSADQVKALASLPSREVLLAKLLGSMQSPVSRFVGVLSGTIRQVVTVLDAIAKKKQ